MSTGIFSMLRGCRVSRVDVPDEDYYASNRPSRLDRYINSSFDYPEFAKPKEISSQLGVEFVDAVRRDDKESCYQKLEFGAPLEAEIHGKKVSILILIADKGDMELFKRALLMSTEDERFMTDESGNSYLHHLVNLPSSKCLKVAGDFSEKIYQPWNEKNRKQETPLLQLLDQSSSPTRTELKKFMVLMKNSSDMNATNARMENVLHLAVRGKWSKHGVVEELLRNGTLYCVNAHRYRLLETPLHIAIRKEKFEIAEELLKFDADLTAKNLDGDSCEKLLKTTKRGKKLWIKTKFDEPAGIKSSGPRELTDDVLANFCGNFGTSSALDTYSYASSKSASRSESSFRFPKKGRESESDIHAVLEDCSKLNVRQRRYLRDLCNLAGVDYESLTDGTEGIMMVELH